MRSESAMNWSTVLCDSNQERMQPQTEAFPPLLSQPSMKPAFSGAG